MKYKLLWYEIFHKFVIFLYPKMNMKEIEIITVTNEKCIRVIQIASLFAITVEDYICTFYIENEEKFSCTQSMEKIEKLLPEYFFRISRNTMINMKKIRSVESKQKKVELISGHTFTYSHRNAKLIREKLNSDSL